MYQRGYSQPMLQDGKKINPLAPFAQPAKSETPAKSEDQTSESSTRMVTSAGSL